MTHPLLVVRTHGTQRQLGAQHGAAVRQHGGFEPLVDYYPKMPHRLLLAGTPGSVADRAMITAFTTWLDRGLRRIDAQRPQGLKGRTEAFFAELGEPSLARHLACLDVFQNALGVLARYKLANFAQKVAHALPPACSSLAVWGDGSDDGRLLHARNFDFPGNGIWERQPTVVFCTPEEGLRYGFVTTRGADVVGVTCFNEAGITLTSHTRLHRDVSFDQAAVVDIGHEIIRQSRSLDDAIRWARTHPSASSWAFLVSSASEREAVVIEVSASQVRVTRHSPGEDFIATTNRYHHPALKVDEVGVSTAFIYDSDARYAVIRERALQGGSSVRDLQRLLGSHRDALTGNDRSSGAIVAQAITVQSIVNDPDNACIYVAVGDAPASQGTWIAVPWSWSDQPGTEVVHAEPLPVGRSWNSGVQREAHRWYAEAVSRHDHARPHAEVAEAIGEAVSRCPEDPSFRFLAGAFALSRPQDAEAHFAVAREREDNPFFRGQLFLWSARAADARGDKTAAAHFREALLQEHHPLLAAHQHAAVTERPWSVRRLRRVVVQPQVVTATL